MFPIKLTIFKTSVKRVKYYAFLALVSLSFGILPINIKLAEATIPKYINFQGKLTAVSGGTNVADGVYSMQFKIYDALTAGSLLWTETFDNASSADPCYKRTVTNGVFNAKLGSCATLAGVDFTTGSLYLSVNVNITGSYDGEMSPRKQLVASPFAFVSNSLNGDGTIDILNTGSNQATIGYNSSNKYTTNVSSAGAVTFDASGSGAGFTFSDAITSSALFTGNLGATISGAAISLNASSNFAVNIATGTSTGAVTIGSTTTTQAITIQSGTGDVNITSTDDFIFTATDDITINGGSAGSIIAIGTNTNGNVINIGTDNTAADTISIGSALDNVAITGDDWSITNAGVLTVASCSGCGGGGGALDTLTAATTDDAALLNADNTIAWHWALTSATSKGITLGESAASTGGSGDQHILKIATASGSTAGPLEIISNSADSGDIEINLNSSGDFEIQDAGTAFATFSDSGQVGIQTAPVSDYLLSLAGTTGNDNSRIIDITQANDAIEDSTVINIVNTVNAGTIPSAATRNIKNIYTSLTPTTTFSTIGVQATANIYGIDNNVALTNVTIPDVPSARARTINTRGTSSSVSADMTINDSNGGSTITLNTYGMYGAVTASPSFSVPVSTSTTATYAGGYFNNTVSTAGDANFTALANGVMSLVSGNLTTTGATSHAGGYFDVSGTAINNYGLQIASVTAATNNYGLYIDTVASAATNYAIYSNAAAQSYFAGNLGLGTTAPDKVLEVNAASGGTIRLTYNDSNGSAATYGDLAVTSGGLLNLQTSGNGVTLGGGATSTALRFLEASGNGTEYAAIKADSVSTSYTWTLPAADASGCIQSNGAGALSIGACGGGSQTPWTSAIDADGYALQDALNLEFRTAAGSAPAGSVIALYADNSGDLTANVLTGKTLNIAVNGSDEYTFSSSALDLNSNNVTNVGTSLTATAGLTVSATSADLTLATTTSGSIILQAASSGTTGNVVIGEAGGTPDLLVLGTKTTAGNPSAVDGAMYYNSNSGKFYIAESGSWKELCNKTDAACGAGSGSAWSALTNPSGNLTLANAEYTTTFSFDTAANAAAKDYFNLVVTNDAGTDAASQQLLVLANADAAGSSATEAFLVLDNQDTDEVVSTGIKIQSAAGLITTAIDISDAEIDTALAIGSNDITVGGATISSTEFARLDGKDAALVDTNDAVTTAIIGTGALNSGSITSGFGSIDVGADGITGGAFTAAGLLTGQLGATISGATTSINASSNFATNINTGTSNALVSIGGGSGTFALNTTNIDISNTGAITGATGFNGLVVTADTGVITAGTWNGTALTDAYVSDTLTSSIFIGSGSTTNAIDLATAEVAGTLGDANVSDAISISSSGSVHWDALNNYPAACAAGSAISQLADTTNTCTAFNTDTSITLQDAYDATSGNSISATDARDIAFTLANTATDPNFTITTAAGGAGYTYFSLADGSNASPPSQLVLVDNLDTNQALGIGVKVQSAAGSITTAVDLSDAEIVTALAIGSNTITTTSTTIAATELDLLDGHNAALVDTDDAVTTAIIGTGALNSGSITSGFGSIDNGSDAITTTGTIGTAGQTSFTGNTITASGAIAANGGITFDASTDTIGAFTAAGNIDMNSNLILNIGNSGTDFTAGGGLNIAGTLDSNGDVSIADTNIALDGASTTFTATGALSLTPGGAMILGATNQTATLQGSTTTITSNGAGNDITLTSADDIFFNPGDDSVFTFAAAGSLSIDAATTASTGSAQGVVDINVNTVTNDNRGLQIDYVLQDAAGSVTAYGQRTNLTINTDAGSDHTGFAQYINLSVDDAGSTGTALYVDAGSGAGTEYSAAFMNGNVGIGDASPTGLLTLSGGNIVLEEGNVGREISFAGGRGRICLYCDNGGSDLNISVSNSRSIQFHTDAALTGDPASLDMIIGATGLIGMGDATPDQKLEVMTSSATATQITVSNSSTGDAQVGFELADGTNNFTVGVDNSVAGDPFKISTTALGTNDLFVLDARSTTSAVSAITLLGVSPTIASASTAEYTTTTFTPPTITLTGTTQVTSQMDSILFNQPTITDASAVTVDGAANVTIAGAPVKAGSVTLTNTYALKVNAGAVSTATNSYGLYVDTQTGATNNYAAVFAGGNVGVGDTSPAALFTVGSGDLFQVNSSGAIAAAAGITSSGTITFSGLSAAGVVINNSSGVLSTDTALDVATGGTNISSYTAGDLLYATASTTLAKLAIGSANTILTSTGSAPQWSSSLSDSQISDTLTSSIFIGSGSTTNAIDLATAEVAGTLADGNVSDTLTIGSSGSVHWDALNNYPAACAAGSAISQLADTTNTCTSFNTDTSITLQDAYNATSGNTIETASNTPVIITETTAATNTGDLLQLTSNVATGGTHSGDLLQLTMDAVDADAFSGNGINVVIDQSQNTGNAILVQDDAATVLFQLDENGALTLGAAAAQTTAITITDTDYTNSLSIGDNNITGTTYSLVGTTATIDFTDFDVDNDGKVTLGPDSAGDDLTIAFGAAANMQAIVIDAATFDSTAADGIVALAFDSATNGASGINIDIENVATSTSGTRTISGISVTPTISAAGVGGTHEIVGAYIQAATGTAGAGTQNLYGVRIGNQGAGTNTETTYGLYVDSQTGGGTASYAAVFAGGNVGVGTTTPTAALHVATNGAASVPGVKLSGSWFTGGDSTTTKPQLLVEASGASSTGWSTSGTGLGINAPNGFAGRIIDAKVNGTSSFALNEVGGISILGQGVTNIGSAQAYWYQPSGATVSVGNNGDAGASNLLLRAGASGSTGGKITFSVDNADQGIWNTSGLGVGNTGTVSAKLHVISTTEQMRLGYDASNYVTHTVSSAGALTQGLKASTQNALKVTDSTNAYFSIDTRTTTSAVSAITLAAGTNPTIASASTAEYTTTTFTPPTITLTGTTQVTSQMDSILFNQPTITDASAVTVDGAANVTIAGAPVKAGSVTLTNTYALKVNAGAVSTATNSYGLYVDTQTGATNNYAAVFAGGNVGIGTATPAYEMDISKSQNSFTALRVYNSSNGAAASSRILLGNDTGVTTGQIIMSGSGQTTFGGANSLNIYQTANAPIAFFTNGTNERMRITGDGKLGFGDTVSVASANLPAGSMVIGNGAFCVDNSGDNCDDASRTAGTIYSVGTSVTGIDVAENYPSKDDTLLAGEVVSLDEQNPEYVKRSMSGESILGIVSTQPGVVLGGFGGQDRFANDKQYPIALSGRVPVKVTNENGNIQVGDYLTPSKLFSGFAAKANGAGTVIGKSLSNFSSTTINDSGSVLVFVKVEFWTPRLVDVLQDPAQDLLSAGSMSNLNMTDGSVFDDLVVTDSVFVQRNLRVSGVLIAAEIQSEKLTTKELCLDDLCVTKKDLQKILDLLNQQSSTQPAPASGGEVTTPPAGDTTVPSLSGDGSGDVLPPAETSVLPEELPVTPGL